jgi:hypothetical protein
MIIRSAYGNSYILVKRHVYFARGNSLVSVFLIPKETVLCFDARKKQCSYAHFKQKLVSISLYGAVGACLQ